MLAPFKRQNRSRKGNDVTFLSELIFTGGRTRQQSSVLYCVCSN